MKTGLKTVRFWIPAFAGMTVLLAGMTALAAMAGPTIASRIQTPDTPARRAAHRPNIELYAYRRSYTTHEKVELRLSAYNLHELSLAAYRIDLAPLIRNSQDVRRIGKRVSELDLANPVRRWKVGLGKIYPDQWQEAGAKLPALSPGVYAIEARGGGAVKRTWLAITDVALLTKRSRKELLVYAVEATSGRPIGGLGLAALDQTGAVKRARTNGDGILSLHSETADTSPIWLNGSYHGSPAFLLSGAPPVPESHIVYMYTDRPIYRPGHKVQFRGTVRERLESDEPGGFTYRPYANGKLLVEIRDPTDALIYRKEVVANANGSFSGELQLASEPALGRWQLVAAIGAAAHRHYGGFEVQAYRKPEFTASVKFEKPHSTGGDTIPVTIESAYYFGQPVAGAAVRYSISFQPQESGEVEPPYQGQGTTDSAGKLKLEIKTQRRPINRTIQISAGVTDLSRRTVTGSGSALITSGLFRLSVQAERSVYHPKDVARITVKAEDYDGKPVAAKLQVRLIETKYDRDHRPYREKTERSITTDSRGSGTAEFEPARPGYLEIEAEAFDSDDNKIQAHGYLWITGDEYEGYDYSPLTLVADRTTYQPGEIATVLVNTSLIGGRGHSQVRPGHRRKADPYGMTDAQQNAWALVTVDGEQIYYRKVVHLTSRTTELRIPIEARWFPSIELSVAVMRDHALYEQTIRLQVPLESHRLAVNVVPDKPKYAPGEPAAYMVSTRDSKGRPVSAEIGLGVVDAAIYAIRPDDAPDLFGFFYGGQEARVHTDFSFAAQYSGGAFQTVPKQSLATPPTTQEGIRIRRNFADTAYWNPSVVTDAVGNARVSFTVPDNLTTWRATARGISLQTSVGQGTSEVVSTMPLLVRLELPRFYVQGDEAVVSAVVHNYTGVERTVHARLESAGASLLAAPALNRGATNGEPAAAAEERSVQIPANGERRLDWRVSIGRTELARFMVVADGGEGARDAAELTLPVKAAGVKSVQSQFYEVVGNRIVHSLDGLPPNASVSITVQPSLASAMLDALEYLTSFPYGCAEQTTSSWLPDVIVARALKRLGVNRKVHPDLEKWVNLGLQKLYRYQHQDGGWNWWEFDQTDGDMTAYVLYGLIQAKDAGYLVDEARIQRGAEALLRLLAGERELSKRADWLLTLSYVRKDQIRPSLDELFAKRDKIDYHAQATLSLALAQVGMTAQARTVAAELAGKVKIIGTTAHWPAEEGGYSWNDDVEVTAHVLRAILTSLPDDRRIPQVVRWLMGNRSSDSYGRSPRAWSTTRASAEAVFALTQYLEKSGQLMPRYHACVMLDGAHVKSLEITPESALEPPVQITLTADQLRGHRQIEVDRDSTVGSLFATVTTSALLPEEQTKPIAQGIHVRRSYKVQAEDPSHADVIDSGTDVEVDVEVMANANYKYALLEEPIPAGCEVAATDDISGRYSYYTDNGASGAARQEVRDDRLLFYLNDLPKGRTRFTYRLHAETPGAYKILPSLGWLMYFPEIRGNGSLVHARIGESK